MDQVHAIIRKYKNQRGIPDDDYLRAHELGVCVAKYEYALDRNIQEYIDKRLHILSTFPIPAFIDDEDSKIIKKWIESVQNTP